MLGLFFFLHRILSFRPLGRVRVGDKQVSRRIHRRRVDSVDGLSNFFEWPADITVASVTKKTAAKCDVTGVILTDARVREKRPLFNHLMGFVQFYFSGQGQKNGTQAEASGVQHVTSEASKCFRIPEEEAGGGGWRWGKNLNCKYNHECKKAKRGVRSCRARLEGSKGPRSKGWPRSTMSNREEQ